MRTTLDLALIRWMCANEESRRRYGTQGTIELLPFIAGWAFRDMEAGDPGTKVSTYRSSFWAGWKECDARLKIMAREEPHLFILDETPRAPNEVSGPPTCKVCGLIQHANVHQEPSP